MTGRKSKRILEIDESDDCELIQQEEGVSDDQFDENDHDSVTANILNTIISSDLPDNSGTINFDLENSAYVKVTNDDGEFRVIKKSAIVWFLENYVRKLSNDRNLRVMQGATYQDRQNNVVKNVEKRSIRMADWCVFKSSDKESKYLIGKIISLCRMDGKKTEGSKFVWEWIDEENIGALCVWYSFEKRGNDLTGRLLETIVSSHGFHPCQYYVCSVPPPKYENENELWLSANSLKRVTDFIKKDSKNKK